MATKTPKLKIVRTYSAGVFFGEIESRNGQEVVMRNARRLWYGDGAASLSQLAVVGVAPASDATSLCPYRGGVRFLLCAAPCV